MFSLTSFCIDCIHGYPRMTSILGQIYAAEEEKEEEEEGEDETDMEFADAEASHASHASHKRRPAGATQIRHHMKSTAEARLTKAGLRMNEVKSGYKGADKAFLVKNADVFKVSVHEALHKKYMSMRDMFNAASNLVKVFVLMLLIYICLFVVIVSWMFIAMVFKKDSKDYFVRYMTMGACMWVFGLGALYVAMKV